MEARARTVLEQPVTSLPVPVTGRSSLTLLVSTAVFICGAVLMGLEIVGSRVLAPHFGNSIYVWGSLISVFLAALSLGYYAGGRLSTRARRLDVFAGLIAIPGFLVLLLPSLAPPVTETIAARDFGPRWGPLLGSALLFLLPGVFLGTVSPYAVRVCATALDRAGATAGTLYAISTAGSILGTLLTAFWLIPAIGVSSILHVLGWSLLTVAAVLLWHARHRGFAMGLMAFVAVSGMAFGSGVGLVGGGNATVFQKDTLYHRLRVVDRDGLRTLYFDRMRQSAMALADPDRLEMGYARAMALGLAFQPEGERHLFIGLGGGSLPKWVHRRFPRTEVDVAELDPEVVRVARRLFAVPDDPRLRLHEVDGRVFVRRTAQDYDLVFLDAYFADALPFHLLTREFFGELRTRLRPGGAVVLNLIGALDGPGSRLYWSVLRTLRAVYPEVYTIPVTHPDLVDRLGLRRDARRRNLILVAPREGRGWTRADLLAAADRLIAVGRVPPEARGFAEDLVPEVPAPDGIPVLLDEHAPVDDLIHL